MKFKNSGFKYWVEWPNAYCNNFIVVKNVCKRRTWLSWVDHDPYEEEFFVDDEATVLLDQQPWRMDLFTVDIVLVLVAIVAWPVFVEAGGAYELDLAK